MTGFLIWLKTNSNWAWSLGVLSVVFFVLTPVFMVWLITRLPKDYFLAKKRTPSGLKQSNPFAYGVLKGLKNLAALVLVLAGIAMLVLPGQGILTIFIGLTLADFPGKYKLERALIERPAVFNAINWIRKKRGKPEMLKPDGPV